MLFKHWDAFVVGVIAVGIAFTIGFVWGANRESYDYISITSDKLGDVLPFHGNATANGRDTCLDRVTENGKELYWLHSC